jgi:hypothetical protein
LCSTNCPCAGTNFTGFAAKNPTYTSNWVIDPLGAQNFTMCSNSSKVTAYNAAIKIDGRLDTDQTFNAAGFATSFAYIEQAFKCTGWCSKQYILTTAGVNRTIPMLKYLYSNINL